MPAVSKAQQRFMGADLARKRAGTTTRTGLSAAQMQDDAETERRRLPARNGNRALARFGSR